MRFLPGRHALRRLLNSRSFTATAVMTLALGIAATVAVFSVVYTVLLEPLPYEDPNELVSISYRAPGLGIDEVSQSAALNFVFLEQSNSFESVAMWTNWSPTVTGIETPEQIRAHDVTFELLPLLGVEPIMGRAFAAEDDEAGAPLTALLTYDYWQQRYGGQEAAVGQTITLQDRDHTIIGVLPRGFRLLDDEASLLLPMQIDRDEVFLGMFNYRAVGRLEAGVTVEQAIAEMDHLIPVAADQFPGGITRQILEEAQFASMLKPLDQEMVGSVSQFLWILFAAVGVVFVIACANVANLFLVRSESRHRELAVRSALGAGRSAIVRDLLSESLWLGLIGGALAVPIAWLLIGLLQAFDPVTLPRVEQITLAPPVLGFAFAVSILSGLLFGLGPAVRQSVLLGSRLNTALKEGGRSGSGGRTTVRAGLVVAQIALGLILLFASALLVRSFDAMRKVDPGFSDPNQVITFRMSIPSSQLEEPLDATAMQRRIWDNLAAIPGIDSVGAIHGLPTTGWNSTDALFFEDFPVSEGSLPPVERMKFVAPGIFETLRQSLIVGRTIDWRDIEERREVVVVSEDFAIKYWDSPQAALGRRVATGLPDQAEFAWREIVGVVASVHDDGPTQDTIPTAYFPIAMDNFWGGEIFTQRNLHFAMRTSRVEDPSLIGQMQDAVWSVNPTLPLARVETLGEIYDRSMAQASFAMSMLLLAAAAALLIGAVGIYGVVAYLVSQRTREFGVRLAMGASGAQVRALVMRYGMLLTLLGVTIGTGASVLLAGSLSRLVYAIEVREPWTFVWVALGLSAITLLAAAIASRKAAQIDPIEALRAD